MLDCLPPSLSGKTALDGGCGVGFFSEALAQRGAQVTSIDIAPSLVRLAVARADSRGVAADVARLPFADRAFDIVLSSECIEHTVDPAASFASLARVVKPGGILVLSVPNHRWIWSLRVAERLKLRPYHGLENWPTPAELRRFAEQAGLRVVRHFGVHPLPFQLPLARHFLPLLEKVVAQSPLDHFMINQVIVAARP